LDACRNLGAAQLHRRDFSFLLSIINNFVSSLKHSPRSRCSFLSILPNELVLTLALALAVLWRWR